MYDGGRGVCAFVHMCVRMSAGERINIVTRACEETRKTAPDGWWFIKKKINKKAAPFAKREGRRE